MKIFNQLLSRQTGSLLAGKALSFLITWQKTILIVSSIAFAILTIYYARNSFFAKNRNVIPLSKADFKNNWKKIVLNKNESEKAAQNMKFAYEQTNCARQDNQRGLYDAPLGTVYGSMPANFGMWMPGVALVASYLSEKKNVKGIHVCQTLEAFATQLNEIALSDADQRAAFIIGTVQSGLPRYGYRIQPNFPQHKVAVCVERKEGTLSIAVMDSQPLPGHNHEVTPDHLNEEIWEGFREPGRYSNLDLVFRAILKGCRGTSSSLRLTHSKVLRQKSFGCAEFALHDAVAFLRDPEFFNKIACSNKFILAHNHKIEGIVELPPEFMIGLQGTGEREEYKTKVDVSRPLIGKKKNLQQYFEENVLEVSAGGDAKGQNLYITKKHFTYLTYLTDILSNKSEAEIREQMDKTLITKIDPALFRAQVYAEAAPGMLGEERVQEVQQPPEDFVLIE